MPGFYEKLAALILYLVMVFTDVIDGILAERMNLRTKFGNFLDPVADKIMISLALIILVDFNLIASWVAIVIIAREFVVTGIRSVGSAQNRIISANIFGKSKFALQSFAIFLALLLLLIRESSGQLIVYDSMLFTVVTGFMYLAAIVTIVSTGYILIRNRNLFK